MSRPTSIAACGMRHARLSHDTPHGVRQRLRMVGPQVNRDMEDAIAWAKAEVEAEFAISYRVENGEVFVETSQGWRLFWTDREDDD